MPSPTVDPDKQLLFSEGALKVSLKVIVVSQPCIPSAKEKAFCKTVGLWNIEGHVSR